MAAPTLTPSSQTSKVILTSTGSAVESTNSAYADSAAKPVHYPFGMYVGDGSLRDDNFVSGAMDQVAFTYKKLGGDVLDIELTVGNIYASYEESVLEYSYQINTHQAKNVLSDLLGMNTGTFDHDGQMTGGTASGSAVNLSYPRFEFRYARRVADGFAGAANAGGHRTMYSASVGITASRQDYDLQAIIYSASANNEDPEAGAGVPYAGLVGDDKIRIERVFFKTPQAMWRFYGYYGGLNVVGNLNYYGQFSDDTTFEIIPSWHNKLQAQAYEDHLWTRLSHYSYELHNNNLRLFPIPDGHVRNVWVEFTIDKDGWSEERNRRTGASGINNVNTLPFENIPYKNINAIGKQWIRNYALALSKEVLGQIRGKFGSIPIPGESVTLNASDLLGQAKAEQDALKEELKTILDEMTYKALAEKDAAMVTAIDTVQQEIPMLIYQG
jgi:hypothetical protein